MNGFHRTKIGATILHILERHGSQEERLQLPY